jgi:N-acetyl-anhydromuramyl-L-alanine amidase AmpD
MELGKIKNVLNIGPEQADNVHGRHKKDLIVLHETVSGDIKGWADVKAISSYLDNKDYGIHGIVDFEGNIAWAFTYGSAIFYHASSAGTNGNGLVNSRGIGIELVSKVMLQSSSMKTRWQIWWARKKQIMETAKLVAWASRVHDIPLVDSDSSKPGVTTHYEVTDRWGVTGGHVDCWPKHRGGYFPKLRIIQLAKLYRKLGY